VRLQRKFPWNNNLIVFYLYKTRIRISQVLPYPVVFCGAVESYHQPGSRPFFWEPTNGVPALEARQFY